MKVVFVFLRIHRPPGFDGLRGERMRLEPQSHESIAKYETYSVDFYLDAALVKEWLNKCIETNDRLYFANGGLNDSALVAQLNAAIQGDTIVIGERTDSGARVVLDKKIFELCKAQHVLDMNIYDKERKQFISKIHARQFEGRTSHGFCTYFTLINADHVHPGRDYFYSYSFNYHGGF